MAVQIPDSSVKSTSVGDVTQADIEEFRRSQEAKEFVAPPLDLSGEQYAHMESSRYDAVPRGYQAEYSPETAPSDPSILPQNQPAYQPTPAEQEPDYKQKYGQTLNEMGEWRRQAMEKDAQLQQLMSELTNRLSTAQAPAPVYYQPPQPPPPPPRLFPDRAPTELATWGEIEEMLNRDLLPAFAAQTNQATYIAKDMAAAEAQRMIPSWDINSSEESQALANLRQRYSNFDQRFTAVEKNNAIRDQVSLLRQQKGNGFAAPPQAYPVGRVGGNGAPSPSPSQVTIVDPSRMVRKQTYVETAPSAQIAAEPTSSLTPTQAFKADLDRLDMAARAKGQPRATAKDVEALFAKHGIGKANDWGSAADGILSR